MRFAFRVIMSQAILRRRRAQARLARAPRHRRLALRWNAGERQPRPPARPTWRRSLHGAEAPAPARIAEPAITEHSPAPPA